MDRAIKFVKSERGLTLVEIIVVLIILAVIMSIVAGKIFSSAEQARQLATNVKIQELKNSINVYNLRYNSMPPTLDALVKGTPETGAGFIALTNDDGIRDAWGTPFIYQSDGKSYTIRSLGADRTDGGTGADADMTVPGP